LKKAFNPFYTRFDRIFYHVSEIENIKHHNRIKWLEILNVTQISRHGTIAVFRQPNLEERTIIPARLTTHF